MPGTPRNRFSATPGGGADFLLTDKGNQKIMHRQIRNQFQGKRYIPFVAGAHEISHGRDITWTLRAKPAPEQIREASWIVEVFAVGTLEWHQALSRHPSVSYEHAHHPRCPAANGAGPLMHRELALDQ